MIRLVETSPRRRAFARRSLLLTAVSLASLLLLAAACDSTKELAFGGDTEEADAASDVQTVDASHDVKPTEDASVDDAADAATPPPPLDYDASDEAVVCADAGACATRLTAGERHVCARMTDGTVKCWGDNTKGAVGEPVVDPLAADASTDAGLGPGVAPRTVANVADATNVSAADDTTCARLGDGTVKCWGANNTGQLGLTVTPATADTKAHAAATTVALTGSATRVDVGHGSVCAVLDTGDLWCWGANAQGQLLRGASLATGGPAVTTITGLTVSKTMAGNSTIYGLSTDGTLFSWGMVSGRDTSFPLDPAPHRILPLQGVSDMATSASQVDTTTNTAKFHTCTIANGHAYCWGAKIGTDIPALCTGVPNDFRTPTLAPVSGTAFPQQVAVARYTTCVRLTDGTIECCGDDTRGQMGTGTVAANPAVLGFTKASALTGYAVQVVTTQFATCALLKDGTVSCWGGNQYGELGQGSVDAVPHATPVNVTF